MLTIKSRCRRAAAALGKESALGAVLAGSSTAVLHVCVGFCSHVIRSKLGEVVQRESTLLCLSAIPRSED